MTELPCAEHSGVCAKIENVENNVSEIRVKMDGMQKFLLTTCVAAIMSCVGVIGTLIVIVTKP